MSRWALRVPGRRTVAGWLAALALVVTGGCAKEPTLQLPPVVDAPTEWETLGKFVWFDLLTEDVDAATRFYTELFGWEAVATDEYTVLRLEGRSIAGIAPYEDREADAPEALWLVSMSVPDVGAAAQLVRDRGGEVLEGPLSAEERGELAVVTDPQGAAFILLRTRDGDPADTQPPPGDWLWVDLFTRDLRAAEAFYGALIGYQAATVVEDGEILRALKRDGKARAGLVRIPWRDVEPNWLPYVRVEDLEATVQRARTLGATTVVRLEDVAILIDPTGAAFGIQQP